MVNVVRGVAIGVMIFLTAFGHPINGFIITSLGIIYILLSS